MKAIDTRYAGRRFRSRLEARWAVCFDGTWIRWDYEPEGIHLPSGVYLPDFTLRTDAPDELMWVEIKPRHEVPERSFSLLTELASESGEHAFLLSGPPMPGELEWWHFKPSGRRSHRRNTTAYPHLPERMLHATDVPWDDVTAAMRIAMEARFEHGEVPRVRATLDLPTPPKRRQSA